MSLRAWFRRHRNVLSISTKEIDTEPGNQEMLREEYGDQAVEERRSSGAVIGFRGNLVRGRPPVVDVSADGILEASEEPEEKSPRKPAT
jgi:hypothetical protein